MLAQRGFENFIESIAAFRSTPLYHDEATMEQRRRASLSSGPSSPSSHHTQRRNVLLDQWLQEAGREAGASVAVAASNDPIPYPGTDGLRTLCILSKACLAPTSSPGPDAILACSTYLKTLIVRGQLSLRPGTSKGKRTLALKNLQAAMEAFPLALSSTADSPAVWRVHLVLVYARLTRSVGQQEKALRVLHGEAEKLIAAGIQQGSSSSLSSEEANVLLAEAYLLLEYTQWLYYDQWGFYGCRNEVRTGICLSKRDKTRQQHRKQYQSCV